MILLRYIFRTGNLLNILDTLHRPCDVHLQFDYGSFDCTPEINILADKLSIVSANPHGEFIDQKFSDQPVMSLSAAKYGIINC